MLRVSALLLVAVGATARLLPAQTFATVDSLLAVQDTSAAIAVLEAMVKRNEKNTEAHYRAGLLYMSRHVPGAVLSPNRRKAEEHLRYASRFAPDSAKYWLALAEAFRTEDVLTTRAQVTGLVNHARKAAHEHGGDPLGQVAYRSARIEWERYEELANRYLLGPLQQQEDLPERRLDIDLMMDDWQYVEDFFQQRARPDPAHPGEADRTEAEATLREALGSNPRQVDAAGLLAVALGEEGRWTEAYVMARNLVLAAPDSGRAHAILGLALARLHRWREAQTAYDRALSHMSAAEREPYDNLGLILKRADSVSFAGRPPAARETYDSLYWLLNQPLYLRPVNEKRVEFYARLTYVLHRWSDPLRGYQGYESDRGEVYLRYGPPDVWATLGREAVGGSRSGLSDLEFQRNTVLWVYYPTHLRFAFSLTPGFARVTFSGNHAELYRVSRDNIPVRFDNVPAVRNLDTIATQVAQFRGDTAGRTDIVVFAATPTGRMVGTSSLAGLRLLTAAIVKDGSLRDVARERREKSVAVGDSLGMEPSTWRLSLPPSDYRFRVEAMVAALDRAARSSETLHVRRFTNDSLQVSDVIAADRIAPKDSTARRWTDFFIDPSVGRFRPGVPVSLLWETYNLAVDSAGLVAYQVDIQFTVQEIERHGFAARLLGVVGDAAGLSAKGDDQVSLSFNRQREAPPDGRAVEFLDVDLQGAPEATYLVTVTITDRHTGRAATAERWFTVTNAPLTRAEPVRRY
jgi:GWxTD domain-containing protein